MVDAAPAAASSDSLRLRLKLSNTALRRAGPVRGISQLAAVGLGPGDELREVGGRNTRMRHEQERRSGRKSSIEQRSLL
jgi:hypothetical protein